MSNTSGRESFPPKAVDAPPPESLSPGTALCLSGGGFRAMLFHAGGIRRLAELDLLDDAITISSVSGGSIASAIVALHWSADGLDVDATERTIFDLAGRTVDVRAVLGAWIRFRAVGRRLAELYDRYIFEGRTLQDVPAAPTFVFNTTNMHTGNSFQWSREAAHDYAVGRIVHPELPLATVVAASSAFPPFLSPLRIAAPGDIVHADTGEPLPSPRRKLWLTDGGVYDNMGLQPVDHLETVVVSDGGAPFVVDEKLRSDWFSVTLRTLALLQDQVGKRRRFEELYAPDARRKTRLIWSLRDGESAHLDADGLPVPIDRLHALGATHTRLAKLPTSRRHELMNLGYALTDHSVRPSLRPDAPPPTSYPYPGGLG